MIKVAVIGDPISHSLSPIIHNFFLQQNKIKGSYQAILVKKENLEKEVKNIVNQGFVGFNVTIPHKEIIFKLCNENSEVAKLTKAVNTVVIDQNKKIFGHNSDAEGFINNLKKNQPSFKIKNKNVFIVGAGGAARAIVYSLIINEAKEIFITNRNQEKAEILIKDFTKICIEKKIKINFLEKNQFEQNLESCDLLINSTSLGMVGQEKLLLNLKKLKPSSIVYDIVYKPLMTDLLNFAQKNGNQVVTGIGMLVEQALVGFELWFKKKPVIDEKLYQLLLSN
jgi:shikimate dehydrogenase